jgi:hypothetical protein
MSYWKATKHILRYVQGTITFGIHYSTKSTLDLNGFTDSDWAGDSIDRKSTSGYSLSLGSRPICWSSKKKSSIALSSVVAEYRGVVKITIQAMWLQHFLTELLIQVDIGGHPPFPTGSKQFSGNFGNLLFLAGFNFQGHFEGPNEGFSRSRFSMIFEGMIEPPK